MTIYCPCQCAKLHWPQSDGQGMQKFNIGLQIMLSSEDNYWFKRAK